jgi:hypothetical protein
LEVAYERKNVTDKEQQLLISPAAFDPGLGGDGDWRTYDNIRHMSGYVFLDFDGGDLTPTTFADEIFPNLQMILYSSWSHTPDNPRFRAVIPCSTNIAMTADIYKGIVVSIARKLQRCGYWTDKDRKSSCPAKYKRSGLDWGKRVATSLFYLPVKKEGSFYRVYADNRRPFDMVAWARDDANLSVLLPKPVVATKPVISSQPRQINEAKKLDAIREWQSLKVTRISAGNAGFWSFAVNLYYAGLSGPEIEQELYLHYPDGRTPNERKAQIAGIVKSLRRYGKYR